MGSLGIYVSDSSATFICRHMVGSETVGARTRFELEVFSPEPVAIDDILGKTIALVPHSGVSDRVIGGVVSEFTAIATTHQAQGRLYQLVVESSLCMSQFRQDARVFQKLNIPDIIAQVLKVDGWRSDCLVFDLKKSHPKETYITQYLETDSAFVQRMCERAGIWYWFAVDGDKEKIHFCDESTSQQPDGDPVLIVDGSQMNTAGEFVWNMRYRRRRRPGKVTVRNYDPLRPTLALEGQKLDGNDQEKNLERYIAPVPFMDEGAGKAEAQRIIEGLRFSATRVSFRSNCMRLRPGYCVALQSAPSFDADIWEGNYIIVSTKHTYDSKDDRYAFEVQAVPAATPVRLPEVTPRPVIHGVHSAVVTGALGEEIHPDEHGNIFIRFHWDRYGPTDHNSSLPVRVAQPNTPGSMVIPRIGWEVMVAFEDGDPDRPYVLGRVYNGKHGPPFPLPANKTVTAIRSFSSPGAGAMNSFHFDDAAGRQHFSINAGFGKHTTVANNMKTKTEKVETKAIGADQKLTVGVNESLTVKENYAVQAASQTATVGGMQGILVKGNFDIGVGSETVMIGGALLEKVGNPVTGLKQLGTSIAIQGISAMGGAVGGAVAGKIGGSLAGTVASMGAGAGLAAWSAPKGQGASSALSSVVGGVAGMIPGGGALTSAFGKLGGRYPWEPAPPGQGAAAAGGGATEVSEVGSAKGPGPGHRNEKVKGAYSETIGAGLAVTSPGSIKWETVGAAVIAVGGAHVVKAKSYGLQVMGLSTEIVGSTLIKVSGTVARDVKTKVETNIAGAYKSTADGKVTIQSKSQVSIKSASMKIEGSYVTFKCGSSEVSVSPGGVLVKASTIEINGATKQSGGTGHG